MAAADPAARDPIFAVLMDSVPPRLTPGEATALVRDHWGITGTADPVACERDANFRIRSAQGDFILKIANPAESETETDFQTAALGWLARRAPGLPVPRVIPGRDGAGMRRITLPDGRVARVRLLAWMPGVPMAGGVAPGMAGRVGALAARIGLAFADFDHPASGLEILWDIRHAARLRPLLPAVAPDLRGTIAAELDRFETHVLPQLPALRWQVIHNDMNPHNILVDPADPGRICGLLDFGDIVKTPLIVDLAVAASYLIHDAPDPVAPVRAALRAYHAIRPLLPAEVALLRDLVVARLVTSVTVSQWRAAAYPQNAGYILRHNRAARDGLARFAALPVAEAIAALTTE